VSERPFTIGEVVAAAQSGRLLEAFGTGTAAVVAPVKALVYKGEEVLVPIDIEKGAGPLAQRVYNELLAIQYGRVPGHAWSVRVP
jgi:branched-chain amino acid aminotransferase